MLRHLFPATALVTAGAFAPLPSKAQETASDSEVVDKQRALESSPASGAAPFGILWDGAPRIGDKNGWSIKPRGRLQFDAGAVEYPDSTGNADESGNEFRRARLGFEATAPGGFGARFEADFAHGDFEVTDAYASYKLKDVTLTAGQHNGFQSLEELTSSRFNSFIERAAFTDAFGFRRRLGISAQYAGDDLLVQGGVFSSSIDGLPSEDWNADARIVAMPRIGRVQLHLGGSLHFTQLQDGAERRYRQRPLLHIADRKPIDTGKFSASSELGSGLEAAAVAGPFHIAGEAFWQRVDRPAGMTNPTFFGGYAELGVFLTRGDSRAYSAGTFDRIKPVRPLNEGGPGAVQINFRYDYLDLSEAGITGGRQQGYLLSLLWVPTNQTRLLFNYGRLQYAGAIPAIDGTTNYDADSFAMRAQVDF